MSDLISVVVTTYERPDAIDACLRALSRQNDGNFEIIVADDGSGSETARVIAAWASQVTIQVKHVWQKHAGFRGGEIRNRGIRASSGTYCIFLDGDCLPRPDFIFQHRRLAEEGWFVSGNRILLSPELTAAVLAGGIPAETWDFAAVLGQRFAGGINRLLPAIRLPLGPLRKFYRHSWEGAKTCNLAVARADLDRVDGFDTCYTGWGLEDSDLVVRLFHAGIGRKDGRFATGVFHLWHPEADRSGLQENKRRLDEVLASVRIQAKHGLSVGEPRTPA